jgi:hypothetical protein
VRFVSRLMVVVVGVAACSSTLQSSPDGDGSDSGSGNDGGSANDVSYPVTFRCEADGGADCPSGQPCPEVPLSSSSCGDLPGVLGHAPTPQTVGRPIGCVVGLSYGNPYYSNTQVECWCTAISNDIVSWQCAI